MSKKPVITTESFAIRHGSLSMETRKLSNGSAYQEGVYYHPLGVVTVMAESRYCRIDTATNGRHYFQTRTDNPTNRQISNFCRNLLKQLHA